MKMVDTKKKFSFHLWENISSVLVHFVERIFFKLGVTVAQNPIRTIIFTWIFVIVSSIGIFKFHIEKNPLNLWVPPESDFLRDTYWYMDKFNTGFRLQKILLVADNILEPDVLKILHNMTNEVNNITIHYNNTLYSISDLCYKVPVVNFYSTYSGKSSGSGGEFADPTLWVDNDFYCGFLETFPLVCLQYNILDLWKNNPDSINNLTQQEIIEKINKVNVNPVTGHPVNYTQFMGDVTRNENGDIVAARSLQTTWFTQVNMREVDMDEIGNLVGTEDWVSVELALWESKFLEKLKTFSDDSAFVNIFYESGRSFGDISGQAMFQEMDKLFLSILLMCVYVLFGLSRFNWLEIKLTLGGVGMLSVAMAYVTSVSWCSILGISFGPVHSSLPFLLMGLGIDDMFVMNACWHNLGPADAKKSIPVKVGLMLKHAGVSIVITSFTDIVALLIGAITILPSLKSFCMYAAMGVFFIFCYSVTFFVAVFTLDIKRMEHNRNGLLFCYRHRNKIHLSENETIFQKMLKKFYKNIVFTIPGKAIVITFTIIMTGFSIESILKLTQRFDPQWFIPEGNYYKDFLDNYDKYYPEEGHTAFVFLGEMNFKSELPNLLNMVRRLKAESYVKDLDAWVETFDSYVHKNFNKSLTDSSNGITDDDFNRYLSKFLYSPIGGRFQLNLKFSEFFRCGSLATNLTASTMMFKFAKFHGPEEYIPAMNHVKDIVRSVNITSGNGYRSVWSKVFGNWITDEIISVEVERNIELALLCVMVCTVILITNFQMCLWIFICVLLTITYVLGWMQRWGMTVDIVCCIGLELAIGLCVDYAAHVGHGFLTISEGTRAERAYKTVTSIGNAVLLGGGATFLSLSLLSMSKAYVFQSFFKIFFLVITFGLFNGLMFLPVMLSLVGPDAHKTPDIVTKDDIMEGIQLNGKRCVVENQIDDS